MEIIDDITDLKYVVTLFGEKIKGGTWTGYLSLHEKKTGWVNNVNPPLDSYESKDKLICALRDLYKTEA